MVNSYIVLVNYQSWKDTIECLESLLKLNDQTFQVIIIDNSPNLDSCQSIQKWAEAKISVIDTRFPKLVTPTSTPVKLKFIAEDEILDGPIFDDKIVLIKAMENKGFAAANNIALKYLQTNNNFVDYIWILNNDTIVEPNSLESLKMSIKKLKVDLVGSCLYEYYEPDKIQSVGGTYLAQFGRIQLKKKIGDKCDYPIGASMFITEKFLMEVGLMCEDYFLFFEEYDWILRAKEKGLNFSIEHMSKIYHKGGAAIGNASLLSDFYSVKSKILFNKKFFPKSFKLFCFIFGSIFCLNRIRRGQIARVGLFVQLLKNPNLLFHEIKHK